MAVNNTTIAAKSWLEGTNDFQQRIPEPTQYGIDAFTRALFDPLNNDLYNQWSNQIINMIGMTYINSREFENSLAEFKKERLLYGKSIREIAPKWFKAHSYQDDDETLLRFERPDFAQWFHTVNRQDKYKCSITRPEIMQAFDSEYGINRLIASEFEALRSSDAYDEMMIMIQLIAEYDSRWGMYKQQISAAPTTEAACKELLTQIRKYAGVFKFPSALYNAQNLDGLPVFARPDELVFITTPEVTANLDVQALSGVFQLDKADIRYRVVEIPEFPVPDCYGMLTTYDWFECHDTVYGIYPFFDPNTLSEHHFLHHQGIYSMSPLVPCVMFTTQASTTVPVITQTVTGLTITPENSTASAGDEVEMSLELVGTVTANDAGIEVEPDSATFELVGDKLNSRTYVDRNNVLHIQKSGLEAGDTIEVIATATYTNPSGETTTYTASTTITIA